MINSKGKNESEMDFTWVKKNNKKVFQTQKSNSLRVATSTSGNSY